MSSVGATTTETYLNKQCHKYFIVLEGIQILSESEHDPQSIDMWWILYHFSPGFTPRRARNMETRRTNKGNSAWMVCPAHPSLCSPDISLIYLSDLSDITEGTLPQNSPAHCSLNEKIQWWDLGFFYLKSCSQQLITFSLKYNIELYQLET